MISFASALEWAIPDKVCDKLAGKMPTGKSILGLMGLSPPEKNTIVAKIEQSLAADNVAAAAAAMSNKDFGGGDTGTVASADKSALAGVIFKALEDGDATPNAPIGCAKPGYWQVVAALVALGVWIPLGIVLTRPFIEHEMLSAVVMVAGSDTGCTLFGPADMQLSANTTVKVIEGHYTGHFKSVVTKPENVLILRDIQCGDYTAGCNANFFGGDVDGSGATAEKIRMGMQNRLEYNGGGGGSDDYRDFGSMLAFIRPYTSNEGEEANGFSITRLQIPWDAAPTNGANNSFPGGPLFAKAYDELLQLSSEICAGMAPSDMADREFVRSGSFNNSFVFPGPWRSYNPFISEMWQLHPGQGHFGPDAVPGVRCLA